MVQATLGLIITSSSSLESDRSLIKVWTMVWHWVWATVWRCSDQNTVGLKSLIRDLLCLESLIRDNFGLEVWSDKNLGLDLNLGRYKRHNNIAEKLEVYWTVISWRWAPCAVFRNVKATSKLHQKGKPNKIFWQFLVQDRSTMRHWNLKIMSLPSQSIYSLSHNVAISERFKNNVHIAHLHAP